MVINETSNKSGKKTLNQRVNEWDVPESRVELLLDGIIAVLILLLLVSFGLVSFELNRHLITTILVPVVVFGVLRAPGLRLRFRETRSTLLVTDFLVLINMAGVFMYIDEIYAGLQVDWSLQYAIAIFGFITGIAYLVRAKCMYYLTVPSIMITDALVAYTSGLDPLFIIMLVFLVPIPFAYCMIGHGFFFGVGRVKVDGTYMQMTEKEAKYVRWKQKQASMKTKKE